MSATIEIAAESPLWEEEPAAEDTVRRAIAATIAACNEPNSSVSVALVDDAAIQGLNRRWRGADKPTNVLSFPATAEMRESDGLLGDIVLAFETIRREAESEEKPLLDHIAHLAVHGALHLLGYDHEDDSEAERMEDRERQILAGLGVPDPYAPAAKRTEPA